MTDAPKLEYGNNRIITPSRGVWRGEDLRFLDPMPGIKWSIMSTNYRTQRRELEELAGMVGFKCFLLIVSIQMLNNMFFFN